MKALKCLYLATNKEVADDVNRKVKAYIDALEKIVYPLIDDPRPGYPVLCIFGSQLELDEFKEAARKVAPHMKVHHL